MTSHDHMSTIFWANHSLIRIFISKNPLIQMFLSLSYTCLYHAWSFVDISPATFNVIEIYILYVVRKLVLLYQTD